MFNPEVKELTEDEIVMTIHDLNYMAMNIEEHKAKTLHKAVDIIRRLRVKVNQLERKTHDT